MHREIQMGNPCQHKGHPWCKRECDSSLPGLPGCWSCLVSPHHAEPGPMLQLILECKTALVQLVGKHFEQKRRGGQCNSIRLVKEIHMPYMPWTWIEQMCLSTIGGWGSLSRQPRTWTESACESTATTHTQTAACESYRWFSPYFHWFLIEFPCKNSYAVALTVWHSRAGGVWRKWDERPFASCDFSHAHWQTEAQNRSAKPIPSPPPQLYMIIWGAFDHGLPPGGRGHDFILSHSLSQMYTNVHNIVKYRLVLSRTMQHNFVAC